MRLEPKFIQLPLTFDADRLREEIAALGEQAWLPHPQGTAGNSALQFISAWGDPANHATKGPMLPTPHLERCPYLQQLLASFDAPMGRTRLMRLAPGAEATRHVDINYYWQEHLRIHVPVVTSPEVRFECDGDLVHMAAGECWVFDTWRRHNAINARAVSRIHLVADSYGSDRLFDLVSRGRDPFGPGRDAPFTPRHLPFEPGRRVELITEQVNHPVVMSPWELHFLLDKLLAEMDSQLSNPPDQRRALRALLTRFMQAWRGLWARFGAAPAGWPRFREQLTRLEGELAPWLGKQSLLLPNGMGVADMVRHLVLMAALNPELAGPEMAVAAPAPSAQPAAAPLSAPAAPAPPSPAARPFDRPIFIVCPPRSGSSLLFETLAQAPGLYTIGGESHAVMESIAALHPAAAGWDSNRLAAEQATPEVAARLAAAFRSQLRDREGHPPAEGAVGLRFLEKTPKNALRVPFLAALFPDAYFIYLYRDPRETLSSMLDAWRSGRFVTYPGLPGWDGPPWSLLLTPGWRDLTGKPLAEIAARQWLTATEQLLDDLGALAPDRWCVASYDRLIAEPQAELERLCGFLGLPWDRQLTAPLPHARHTLTSPAPEKWRHNAAELAPVMALITPTAERARAVFGRAPARRPQAWAAPAERPATPPAGGDTLDLRSSYTPGVLELLNALRSSLLVTTYQSGRVVLVRPEGERLNTHFRALPAPMGLALGPRGLAIGTKNHVWLYQNQPELARKLPPQGRHDACFLPRSCHYTGDIRIHEVAWVEDALWLVNTRFSCLAVLEADHSFAPRWRPPFVSALAPEDRCHLNGLAVVEGAPRYVTALGESDTPQGWREHKGSGGLLMEVPSGELLLRGLSMPHSPRWHDGRLWLLQSGRGELCVADLAAGRTETVARLPGFTRGLAFAGPYALVGLSQVRESVFEGLPIREQGQAPQCGIWVVDTRSGQVAGFLRFEGAVQELFDLMVLPGMVYPELAEPESDLNEGSFVLPQVDMAEVAGG